MDLFSSPPVSSASIAEAAAESQSSKPPAKTRSACDRCHSQKLRCVKNTGQIGCIRCVKLRTSCRFGPRTVRGSKRPQATSSVLNEWQEPSSWLGYSTSPGIPADTVYPDELDSDNWAVMLNTKPNTIQERDAQLPELPYAAPKQTGILWNDIPWPPIAEQAINLPVQANFDHFGNPTATSDMTIAYARAVTSPGLSEPSPRRLNSLIGEPVEGHATHLVGKLASLSVAIYECSTKLSTMVKGGESPANLASDEVPGSRKTVLFAIDEVFRVTADFAEVMRCLGATEREASVQSSQSPVLLSQVSSIVDLPAARSRLLPRSSPYLDEATMLMVMSCHSRLTGIYVSLFHMMDACIQYSTAPHMGQDWTIILPKLQLGGSEACPETRVDRKTPLPATTTSMYMLVITMLSSQLWKQVSDLVRAGRDAVMHPGSADRPVLIETMWTTMADRTDCLSHTIEATKRLQ